MLMAVFIASGFKHQIRTKVIGFGSHIQVLPFLEDAESGSSSMLIDQSFYKNHSSIKAIQSIYPVAYKPGMLQRYKRDENGNLEVQGTLFKGINKDFDPDFIKKNLVEGKMIAFSKEPSKDILISENVAGKLNVKVGDTLSSVLITKSLNYSVKPDFRKFRVAGIYNTGLEEFDKEYVFIDIAHIQKANGWGIHVVPDINDTLFGNQIKITFNTVTDAAKINWVVNGSSYPYGALYIPFEERKYTIIAKDADENLLNDTVHVSISKSNLSADKGSDSYVKAIRNGEENYWIKVENTNGNEGLYAGGFEINLKSWEDLKSTDQWLYQFIGPEFTTKTIIEQQPQIFNWLELVEMNVSVIIGLMLAVAIVNLISAVLVLILERSKLIGLLKAMGAGDFSIQKIFLYFTSNLLLRGIIIGNIIAFTLFVLQYSFEIISLNPETYFVSSVPVQFDVTGFLFVNAVTLVACGLAFFIPVMLVSYIKPVKAIKIE